MRNLRTALYNYAAIGGLNAPTLAQALDGDTRLSETASRTIVVTARKVEESVQEIPVAISAYSAENIVEKSIRDLEDVALLTPGLVFEDFTNGGYGTPTTRGATQFSITGLEQNVSVFINGIYIPRQYAFVLGTTKLERIEVVKGPQSALYGANAFAGAINYITINRSLSKISGSAELGFSEDGGFECKAKANLLVIENRLAVRFGVGHSEFDGGWTINHPDAVAGIYPGTDEWEDNSAKPEAGGPPLEFAPVGTVRLERDVRQPVLRDGEIHFRADEYGRTYPDVTKPPPVFYREWSIWRADADAILNSNATSVDSNMSYNVVSNFRPWMKMETSLAKRSKTDLATRPA